MHAKRLNTLTSLRFFAAAMIVILHMNGTFWPSIGLQGLTTGVSFFFVLSGFILRLVYGELRSADEVKRFYIARIARIWPMHLLSIAMLLLSVSDALPSWKIVVANVLLVQSWIPRPDWYFSLNGVSWSISTELAFYALFPMLTWRLGSNWKFKIACAVGGIVTCSLIYPAIRPANSDEAILVLAGLLYINPVSRILEFIAGMLAAALYARVSHEVKGSTSIWTCAEIVLCVLVAGCITLAWPAYLRLSPISQQFAEWFLQSGQFWSVSILIVTFAIGRGALSAALSARPFVFLGEISFSVYMLHQVIIRAMERHAHNFISTHPFVSGLAFVAITLLTAAGTFTFVEQPARDFIMRRYRRKADSYEVGRAA